MNTTTPISLTVNGVECSAHVEPRRSLADLLRDDLGLTGTHVACEQGVCGACTVLVNGDSVRACLVLAVQVDGQHVETVEGLVGDDGELSPLQRAFTEKHGLQCGFCTPGFLMLTKEFLEKAKTIDDAGVDEVLSAAYCRCTGYVNIRKSILLAAERRDIGDDASTAGGGS